MAVIITQWIIILTGWLKGGDYVLSMTDSKMSEGWLKKSKFIKDGEDSFQTTKQLEVAHLHTPHYLSKGIKEYSQWFLQGQK
jgi:hypothetical protein